MPIQRLTKTKINAFALPTTSNQILYTDREQPGLAVLQPAGFAVASSIT